MRRRGGRVCARGRRSRRRHECGGGGASHCAAPGVRVGGCLHFPDMHAFMHRAMSTYVMSSLECEATDTITVSRYIALRDVDAR